MRLSATVIPQLGAANPQRQSWLSSAGWRSTLGADIDGVLEDGTGQESGPTLRGATILSGGTRSIVADVGNAAGEYDARRDQPN
jgi:hypothetical protein